MNVDYKELYISVQRQLGDLSLMVDRYQNEIIPRYEQLLKAARAERDDNKKAVSDLKTELLKRSLERDAALNDLKRITGCHSCKHHLETCDYRACRDDNELWEWAGAKEVEHE